MNINLNNVEISTSDINFKAKGVDEIMQNLKTIFSTPAGTVPFDREFGINWELIDMPLYQAKAAITVEYIEKIKRYEPRAKVKEVTFFNDAIYGVLIPRVVIGFV